MNTTQIRKTAQQAIPKNAKTLLSTWNYKEDGVRNLSDAIEIIQSEKTRQRDIQDRRFNERFAPEANPKPNKYLYKLQHEKNCRNAWEKRIEDATTDINEISKNREYFDGEYIYQLDWHENADWDYYAKSYKHPKVTIEDRCVIRYKHTPYKRESLEDRKKENVKSFHKTNIQKAIKKLQSQKGK